MQIDAASMWLETGLTQYGGTTSVGYGCCSSLIPCHHRFSAIQRVLLDAGYDPHHKFQLYHSEQLRPEGYVY